MSVLWLIWLVGASRTNNAEHGAPKPPESDRQLYATDYRAKITDSSLSKRRTREEL